MPFPMHDGAYSASITASGDHAQVSGLELDRVHDFVGVDVQPDRVVGLHDGIRVADGATIRGVEVGHILGPSLDLADAAELVLSLLVADPVDGVAALDVVH